MATNILGVPNSNVFLPYTAATKRTKQVSLVKTTDITASTSGTSLGTYTIPRCVAVFSSDSNGVWRVAINGSLTCDAGARTDITLTFANIIFRQSVNQAISSFVYISSSSERSTGWIIPNSPHNSLVIQHASVSSTVYAFTIEAELNAEPTTYTTAANMEGVLPVDVYIQPVSSGIPGIFPATNAELDDVTATRLGLKQYLHGTTYNGGNAPTISAGADISDIGTVVRGIFIPYQAQDGTWRMRFTFTVAGATSVLSSSHFIAINGIVFKNAATFYQVVIGDAGARVQCLAYPNEDRIRFAGDSTAPTDYYCSGDVELNAKPTWAY